MYGYCVRSQRYKARSAGSTLSSSRDCGQKRIPVLAIACLALKDEGVDIMGHLWKCGTRPRGLSRRI